MKICVTSEGDNLQSMVDQRFRRCKYFFYNLEKNKYKAVQNPYINDIGGVGIQSVQLTLKKMPKCL